MLLAGSFFCYEVAMRHLIIGLSAVLLLSACSSAPPVPSGGGIFNGCVRADGSKQFSYHKGKNRNLTERQVAMRLNNDRKAAQLMNQQRLKQAEREKGEGPFYDELTSVLAKNQFCQQGYFELDSQIEPGFAEIVGECNDTASEAQRQHIQVCGPEHQL